MWYQPTRHIHRIGHHASDPTGKRSHCAEKKKYLEAMVFNVTVQRNGST